MKEASCLESFLLSSAPALPVLQCGATPWLSQGRRILAIKIARVQQRKPGARHVPSHLCGLVVVVGAIRGAEPEVCTLHFDFGKVFGKMIVYCIQFAA